MDLCEFDFEIIHIKGKENVAADALSRISISDLKKIYENNVTMLPITRSMTKKLCAQNKKPEIDPVNHSAVTDQNSQIHVMEENENSFNKKAPFICICRQ